jgi:hypothetical protein
MTEAAIPINSVLEFSRKSIESPASEQLIQKFENLMNKPGADYIDAAHMEKTPNALVQTLNSQENLMKQDEMNMEHMVLNSKSMTPVEMMVNTMHLSHGMSVSHFQMQAITSVGNSTKKSFDQLLKNQ